MFRYDSNILTSVTKIYINDLDQFLNDISLYYQTALDNPGYLVIKSNDNANPTVNIFQVSDEVDAGVYQQINVTYEAGITTPTMSAPCVLGFSRNGPTGSGGSTGPTGPTGTGPTGPTGPTGASGPAAFPSAQAAFLSGTQQFATTVTATFNQMTIPIAAGQVYSIRANLPYSMDGNSGGIRLGMLFPSARRAVFGVLSESLAGGAAAANWGTINASGNSVLVTSGTTVPRTFLVEGTLLCSGAGNLIFYGASEAAGLTARFLDGGHIIVWNLGPQAV